MNNLDRSEISGGSRQESFNRLEVSGALLWRNHVHLIHGGGDYSSSGARITVVELCFYGK